MHSTNIATGNARSPRPRILIADDHAAVLEVVTKLLKLRFDVVGSVADGKQAMEAAARLQPDLAVLDITMPELDGIHVARELQQNGSQIKLEFEDLTGEAASWKTGVKEFDRAHFVSMKKSYSGHRFTDSRKVTHHRTVCLEIR